MSPEVTPRETVEYVGPFEHHAVVVNGRRVRYLDAQPLPGGRIALTLDDRFGLDLSLQDAERVVPFIAHAIAVGAGWAAHSQDDGSAPVPRPVSPPMHGIDLEP